MSSTSSSSSNSRVSIPNSLRKTIQNIKEIAGKHSDDDIYAMLRECSMDPNETVHKLLFEDTFHEVKRKRDRKKETVNSRAPEDSGRKTGSLEGPRGGGGGNYSSNYISNGANGGRKGMPRKENGVNHSTGRRVTRSSFPVSRETKSKATPHVANSLNVPVNGNTSVSNGSSSHGSDFKSAPGGVSNLPEDTSVNIHKSGIAPPGTSVVKNPPGPTIVPDVHSSASDPTLVLSPDSCQISAVGPILSKSITSHEFRNHIQINETVSQDVAVLDSNEKASINSMKRKMPSKSVVEAINHLSVAAQTSSSNPSVVLAIDPSPNYDKQSTEECVVALPVAAAEDEPITVKASSQSLPESNDSMLKVEASKLQMKLEELSVFGSQHVIIPDHLQVPESVLNRLSFGSFDVGIVPRKKPMSPDTDKASTPIVEAVQRNDETAGESSTRGSSESPSARVGDYPDHLPSPPQERETISLAEDNVTGLKYELPKQEVQLPPEGLQHPNLHIPPTYNFSVLPHMLRTPIVQYEGPDPQARDASHLSSSVGGNSQLLSTAFPTPAVTQPTGVAQTTTIAMSPQPITVFRHPYPLNYFPYSHYLSPFLMPPTIHPFLNVSGFPQQPPPTGNVYLPPATAGAAAAGFKFSLPQNKAVTNTGNSTHTGIPTGYGAYNSSLVGLIPSPPMTTANATGHEDLAASQLKETNIYTTAHQNEGSAVWISTPGREITALPSNSFYLPPPMQQFTFTPTPPGAFSGIYQSPQTMTPPPNIHQLLQQSQSQATVGPIEPTVPPPGPYLQQQPLTTQLNWNASY